MRKYFDNALKILTKVFDDGSYSNRALSNDKTADMTTKLVYGVLEKNIQIEYLLSTLVKKQPKGKAYTLLKIGTYALLNLDNVPHFAIVSECVEVAKTSGLNALSGFINAVLKRVSRGEYKLPKESDKNYLSVKYSVPQWFIDRLFKEYYKNQVQAMLESDVSTWESIRINNKSSFEEVSERLTKAKVPFEKGDVDTIMAPASSKAVKDLFNSGKITFQATSSIKAVEALNPSNGTKILDLCSAPGGKAVLIGELCPDSKITACDLYKHRTDLIEKYAKRMGVDNISTVLNDATKLNPDWIEQFDYVLVDAPCSCFGTFKKHPDVFLNKTYDDAVKISKTQKSILINALNYAKKGGIVVYSTCTLFNVENVDVVNSVLDDTCVLDNFTSNKLPNDKSHIRILPTDGSDGFFIARLKKL